MTRVFAILNRATSVESRPRSELERELGLTIPNIVPHVSDQWAQAIHRRLPLNRMYPNTTFTSVLQDLTAGLLQQIEEPNTAPTRATTAVLTEQR